MSWFKKKKTLNSSWNHVLTEVSALKGPVAMVNAGFSESQIDTQIITSMKQAIVDNLFLDGQMTGRLDELSTKISGAPFQERAMDLLLFAQDLQPGDDPVTVSFPNNVLHRTIKLSLGSK